MTKRLIAFTLCLALLLGCCLPAQADIATLDQALSRWLGTVSSVRFTAELQLKALMPFEETTLAMLNGVLSHVTVEATLALDGDDGTTAAQIAVDDTALADWTETVQDGRHTFTTSLLPNRELVSANASPADILVSADGAADEEQAADAQDDGLNDSDVTQAFTLLDAITELQGCYQALTDGIAEYATEKKANYNIKNVGKGAWSRVARLTTEQSGSLLPQLRALLCCGMDDAYRAEIAQMTFGKSFVVALYRDADGKDICVYLKGTVAYPDGSKRNLLWQWAFATDGLERTDTFKYEVSKTSGTRDTRVIAASCTQNGLNDEFGLDCETKVTLKRYKTTDICTTTVALAGTRKDGGALTCAGSVGRETAQTYGGDTGKTAETMTVDLLFTPDGDAHTLSGTVDLLKTKDKTTESELVWTLAAGAAQATAQAASADAAQEDGGGVTVSIIPAEDTQEEAGGGAGTEADAQASSLDQLEDGAAGASTQEPAQTTEPAFLVGSAPIGLTAYAAPATLLTVDLDSADADTLQSLLAEAAQNLAGRIVPAVAALPEEDAALLKDGMTDADYAAFLALLETLDND